MGPTPDAVVVELLGKCVHCGEPLPVNFPTASLDCWNCQKTNSLDPEFWRLPLSTARKLVTSFGYDIAQVGRRDLVNHYVEWSAHRAWFPCPSCKGGAAISADGTTVTCTSCGWNRAVDPAPAWMRQINEDVVGFVRNHTQAEKAPMSTVECANCGGPIAVDGSRRSVVCEFCSTTTIIPDKMWNLLHPRVKDRWWLVCLVNNDPRRAPPSAPKKGEDPVYQDNAVALLGGILFGVGVAGIIVPMGVGAGIYELTHASPFLIVVLMVLCVLFLGVLGGLSRRISARKQWQLSRPERESRVNAYNAVLRLLQPNNEVVGRIIEVGGDGETVTVELFSPAQPQRILKTINANFESGDLRRVGGKGALVRAWFDPSTSLCQVVATPSVLWQVGFAGLAPADPTTLSPWQPTSEQIAGYGRFLAWAVVLGGGILLCIALMTLPHTG